MSCQFGKQKKLLFAKIRVFQRFSQYQNLSLREFYTEENHSIICDWCKKKVMITFSPEDMEKLNSGNSVPTLCPECNMGPSVRKNNLLD